MRSHIHAWNMARGWLAERNIWFNQVYGWVVRGSPELGQIFLWLMKAKFSFFCTCLYVDLMVAISILFTWIYVGYNHGLLAGSCHDYFMYFLLIVKMMDARPNWCHYNLREKVVILLVMLQKSFQCVDGVGPANIQGITLVWIPN